MKSTIEIQQLAAGIRKYNEASQAHEAVLKQKQELATSVTDLAATANVDDTKEIQKLTQQRTALDLMPRRVQQSEETLAAALEELRGNVGAFYVILQREAHFLSDESEKRTTEFLRRELDPIYHFRIPELVREIKQHAKGCRQTQQIMVPHPIQISSLNSGRLLGTADQILKHYEFEQ